MKLTHLELKNPVKDLDGNDVPYSVIDGKTTAALSIGQCIRHALTARLNDPSENQVTDEQALKDYDTAKEILTAIRSEKGEVEIPATQSARIQTLSRKVFGKEVGGYIRDVLEGNVTLSGQSLVMAKDRETEGKAALAN